MTPYEGWNRLETHTGNVKAYIYCGLGVLLSVLRISCYKARMQLLSTVNVKFGICVLNTSLHSQMKIFSFLHYGYIWLLYIILQNPCYGVDDVITLNIHI